MKTEYKTSIVFLCVAVVGAVLVDCGIESTGGLLAAIGVPAALAAAVWGALSDSNR